MPVVSLREAIVGEHDGFVDLVFTLDVAAAATTSFTWNTSPGTATAGSDFLTASGSVVFVAGQMQQTVRLTLVDDGVAEGFESFLVTLGGASGLTLAQNQFLVTVADDDSVLPTPGVSVRGGTFDERDGTATFTVVLGAASASTVTVDYTTADGTAKAGADYVANSGTLAFLPGETVKTVSVVLTDDGVAESLERFGLLLSSPVGATLGDASASAVIGASDAPLSGPPRIAVADAVAGESDGWVDLVLTLSGPSASVVSVTVTANASNGTVVAGDFQSRGSTIVNFEPGETTRVLRLQINDDTQAEPAEFIAVSLSNVLNATVAQSRALVAIVDDDAVGAAPAGLSVRDVAVDERAGTATFTVLLGGTAGQAASGAVSVNYATEVATAGAADFVPATGTLVFAPGETVKTVTVDIIDDALAEGIEAFQLVLSGATGAQIHDGRGTAIIGASDGAARTTPRIVADDAVVGEGDGWVDVALRLDAPSASPVSVNVTTSGGSATAGAAADYLLVSTSLTFLPGETLKTVRIAVMDDALAEGDEAIAVVLSGAVGGAVGEGATVIIVDDDSVAAAPLVGVRDVVVDESAGVARFVVTLGGEGAAGLVSVDYATEAGSALAGSDFVAQAGRVSFAPGETVKTVEVALVDDAVAEGAETFALVLSGATGATLGAARAEALIAAGDGTAVATPRVSVHDAVAGEGDGWVDLRVTLDAPGTSFVTVAFNTFNETAGSGSVGDFTAASGTLSFAPGETVKTVRVALTDDGTAETVESFRLALSSPTQATIARAEARVVVVDNDTVVATPMLSVRDAVVDESAGIVSFAVLLGGAGGQASASPVSVAWATGGGTAAAGSDYARDAGTLVFAPGETVKTVTVTLVDDALAEADEWFGLTLSAPSGATLAQADARAVIGANDASAVATPRLSVADIVAGESDGWVDVVVTLSAPSTNLVSVSYQTANGTASFLNSVANDDYVGDNGSLVFAPGETTKVVRLQLHDQAAAEGAEHFLFTLFSPVNATLAKGDGYVHIVDDDTVVAQPTLVLRDVVVDEKAGSATFVVMLGGAQGQASDAAVTVDWATTGGSAAAGSDFLAASGTLTFAPGESVKTVRIDLVDDFAAEGPERFFLDFSSPAGATLPDTRAEALIGRSDGTPVGTPLVSIADAIVGEHDGWVDLVVSLSATSLNPVTVQFATSAGSAGSASPADYAFDQGPIVFAPGETVKIVRIALNDDLLDEGLESFSVLLSGASGATLGDSRALVSIVDDEVVAGAPGLSVRDVTVDEKAGTATFFVLLGGPAGTAASGPVTVDFTTAGGTATSGSDFRPASGTLAFAPGETVKAVTVEIVDDTATEGAESFRLELSNPTGAVIVDGRADATIGGSDAAVVTTPSLFALAATASEGDGWVDVTLRLSAPSAGNVVANYSTTAGTASYSSNADYVVRIGSVAFAPGETTKTVRVQLTDDANIEPLEQFQFQITSASGATFSTAPVGITIVDDDDLPPEVPPEIFVRDVVVDEKAGTAVFTVTLGRDGTSTSTEPVQVRWATASAGTAVAGQDFVASQGDLVFAPGQGTQTVLVNLIDDAVAEPAERFELTLSQPVGGQIVDGRGVAVIGLSDGTLAALPFVSIDPALAIEGEGWVDVVVRLGRPSSSAVQVDWATSAGSAGAGDFVAGAGTLVFAPGETTRTVRVDLVADANVEPDETFTVVLSAAVGGSIAVGTATVTVVDDDGAAPVLRLGLGDDTYAVDRSDARVVEAPDEGRDRVISSAASFTLPEHVEELQLSGAATAGTGNAQDNLLVGNEGGDSLAGGAGRDTLDGGVGADTMSGGLDSDVFRVDDIGDVVVELADGGIDTVRALIGYTLGEHVEGLVLEGGKAFSGTGNGLGNSILGNALPNLLTGLAGGDSIDGGGGDDRIDGGDGDDTLLGGDGADTLLGGLGVDLLDGGAGAGSLDGGPGNDTYVVRDALTVAAEATGSGVDLVKAYVNHTLGAGIENLVLMEGGALVGVGNALPNRIDGNRDANVLVGAAGADTLNGYYGADTMQGGPGSDRYVFSGLADVVIELAGQGIDTIVLGDDFSLTQDDLAGAREVLLPANVENLVLGGLADRRGRGNELDNHITDGAGDNILFGMAGNDTLVSTAGADVLVGGVGDDVYLIGRNTARVDEYAGGGVDTVHVGYTWVLGDHVEHLVLTGTLGGVHGTGNASANSLTGNSAANRLTGLDGDDTLDGAAGADTLMGGLGNDLYVIDSSGDVVTEGVAEGIDTVRSSVTHVLGDNFEHLVLAGKLAINGTGNAKFNQITGNAGANVLDGQAGSDTMSGGAGNDTYWVDSIGDVVRELAGGGTDLVRSAVNFIMPANVENLRLTGTARIATGNASANVIVGNASANTIKGGAGSDTLTGSGGADLFVLDSLAGADTIRDFTVVDDTLRISQAGIRIGDGDTVVDGAQVRLARGGFSASAELVLFTPNAADLTTAGAAAVIGSATSAFAAGASRIFVVDNGSQTGVFRFVASANDALVSPGELTLLALLEGTATTALADYVFVA